MENNKSFSSRMSRSFVNIATKKEIELLQKKLFVTRFAVVVLLVPYFLRGTINVLEWVQKHEKRTNHKH